MGGAHYEEYEEEEKHYAGEIKRPFKNIKTDETDDFVEETNTERPDQEGGAPRKTQDKREKVKRNKAKRDQAPLQPLVRPSEPQRD